MSSSRRAAQLGLVAALTIILISVIALASGAGTAQDLPMHQAQSQIVGQ